MFGSMVIILLFVGMLPGVVVGWPAGVVAEVYREPTNAKLPPTPALPGDPLAVAGALMVIA